MPIPSSLHDAVRQSFDDVVISGRHLSTAIENLFRTVHPAPGLATTLRSTLFQAIRYNNVEAALAGSLDTILDPDLADIPPFLRELVAKTYGKDQNKVLCSFLTDAPTFVRVNTIKVSVDECLRALRPFRMPGEPSSVPPWASASRWKARTAARLGARKHQWRLSGTTLVLR